MCASACMSAAAAAAAPLVAVGVHRLTLSLRHRHLFVDLPEGVALVDTGAPSSSSVTGTVTWRGKVHAVANDGYMGFTFDKLSADVGCRVDVLLGGDMLAQVPLLFDVGAGVLTVGAGAPADTVTQAFDVVLGSDVPVLAVSLNGLPARLLFDTGAQYGYVAEPRFTAGLHPLPGFEDFSPLFGDLRFPVSFKVPVTLAGLALSEHVAVAPEARLGGLSPVAMAPFLRSLRVDGILGPSWMPFVQLWLDPVGRRYAVVAGAGAGVAAAAGAAPGLEPALDMLDSV